MEVESALKGARTVAPNTESISFFNHHSFPQEGKSESPTKGARGTRQATRHPPQRSWLLLSSAIPNSPCAAWRAQGAAPRKRAQRNVPAQLCWGRNPRQRHIPLCSQLLVAAFLFHPTRQPPLPQICQRSYMQEHPLACFTQNSHTSLKTINTQTFLARLIFDRAKLGVSGLGS